MQALCKFILKLSGWKLEDHSPNNSRYVLVVYPHTSNWDFILGMIAKYAMGLPLNWVAKKSIFRGPFKYIFIAMGGVPVDRGQTTGFIQKNIDLFQQRENFILGIMPEGTRSRTQRWKSGFYYIAHGANVPVALAYMDYKNKRVGVGKVIKTTGDIELDFEEIKVFYQQKSGLHPAKQGILEIKK